MDREQYIGFVLKKKQDGKKLNFWDRKAIKHYESFMAGYSEMQWFNERIDEILKERNEYIKKAKGNLSKIVAESPKTAILESLKNNKKKKKKK